VYENENLLFKDFQDFLSRKQHIPENRLPYYLRWVSRYHDFCSRENIHRDLGDGIAAHLQYPDRHHEDWQLQQAREAVRRTDTSRECRGSHQRKRNSQTDRYRGKRKRKRKRKRSSGLSTSGTGRTGRSRFATLCTCYIHAGDGGDCYCKPDVLRPIVMPRCPEVAVEIIMSNMRTGGMARERYLSLFDKCQGKS
jgi:hypothetical protein